ncbi:hypothetical protein Bca52824_028417 [Brassica carinata]|uniref:Uncharacterized protein n=1 Tax=Brassica carinata TaxID=52824 RepID=A0A8X7VC95_BRACI|nr:hypothetical protein Bca52824_028417 [Brassica carinata]
MDFKGITWVGKVYQKFEEMCLEVEEIIVQDTAKYVENQVQTVGNSVKRFCSDVVQDLRPDEHAPPVCSSFEKKKGSMKQEDVTEGKKDGFAMELRGVDADDYDICTSPRQSSSYGGPYRRTRLGRKQGFKKEVTRAFVQRDSTSLLSMVHRTRVGNDVGTVKSSDPPPPTDIRTEDEHSLAVANSVRSQDAEIQPCFAISLPKGSDDFRKDADRMQTSSSSVSEQKPEILQQLSGRSVEESCIIVDRDELHCVFPDKEENDKHKPYKKFRDALTSRMKQNREQEYKRLARQWYTEDVQNVRECGENLKQIEEDRSSEESEWELL